MTQDLHYLNLTSTHLELDTRSFQMITLSGLYAGHLLKGLNQLSFSTLMLPSEQTTASTLRYTKKT